MALRKEKGDGHEVYRMACETNEQIFMDRASLRRVKDSAGGRHRSANTKRQLVCPYILPWGGWLVAGHQAEGSQTCLL